MTGPNILLIILDTMRRDRLSAYGHARDTSPNFDAFATDATLFERAISPAQWTVPAHGSLFTGLYPGAHGLTQADGRLADDLPTLAELLHDAGYHTAGFCNNPLLGVLEHGLQRGFDEFYNYAGVTPNRPIDMRRSTARRQISRRIRRFARTVSNQFAQSDLLFRVSLNPAFVPLWTRLINFKGDTGKSIGDLIDYWTAYSAGGADRPLFAFLNLMGTHLPYRPPQDYLDRVAPRLRGDSHAYTFMGRMNADAAGWASPADPPLEDWQHRVLTDFYDAEIAHQDYHLGRLFDMLRKSGQLDNTLVIVAADHGEGHGDHNFMGHSFVVYQELVHVPLVVRYPERFPAGKRVTTNVSTRRIFHTVLDTAGIEPHKAPERRMSEDDPNANVGRLTLAVSTNGRPDPEGSIAYAEAVPPVTFLNTLKHRNPSVIERLALTQVRRGVYDGAHKLTMIGGQAAELFDVADDPAEKRDVADQNPTLVADLQRKLTAFVADMESQRAAVGQSQNVSDDVVENLRSLGYLE